MPLINAQDCVEKKAKSPRMSGFVYSIITMSMCQKIGG